MKKILPVFVGIYLLIEALFYYISKTVYKGVLINYGLITFGLIFICLAIGYFLREKFYKVFIATNTMMIVMLAIFLSMMMPAYTYKEATDIIAEIVPVNTKVIYTGDEAYSYRIGLPQLLNKDLKSIKLKGEYLIYTVDIVRDIISVYQFNPENGEYILRDDQAM